MPLCISNRYRQCVLMWMRLDRFPNALGVFLMYSQSSRTHGWVNHLPGSSHPQQIHSGPHGDCGWVFSALGRRPNTKASVAEAFANRASPRRKLYCESGSRILRLPVVNRPLHALGLGPNPEVKRDSQKLFCDATRDATDAKPGKPQTAAISHPTQLPQLGHRRS